MEVDFELASYLVDFYHQFLTEEEVSAKRHLMATLKMTRGQDDISGEEEARNQVMKRLGMLSEDPEVLLLAKDGYRSFAIRAAIRMFAEHGDKILLNRCPKCGGLARTPFARQCWHCFHDWH